MPFKPVDTNLKIIVKPAIDDTDFKTREETLTYDQAGMEVDVILEKPDGTIVITAVTPTTLGDYDWTHLDQGSYELELPASGGVSFNNTEEGILTVEVYCTGVLPFGSVSYDIVPTQVFNSIVGGTDYLQVDTVQIESADPSDTIKDALNDISVADIIAGIADGDNDLQEMLRIIFSAACLKSNGGGTATLNFRNSADTKNRITATVDENGNRIDIALDGT